MFNISTQTFIDFIDSVLYFGLDTSTIYVCFSILDNHNNNLPWTKHFGTNAADWLMVPK